MANDPEVRRRRHSKALKQQVTRECEAPGASVAKVAMAHAINANVVHSWRKRTRQELKISEAAPPGQAVFVPMMQPPAAVTMTATQPPVHTTRPAHFLK